MRWSLVRAENSEPLTRGATNCYVLHGAIPVLIDAASPTAEYVDRVADALGGEVLATLAATHGHGDHVAGAAAIAARWQGAASVKIPWPERDASTGVDWTPLRDKQFIPAGDGQLLVLHTPGHAPDHACYFDLRSGTLFGGDLVMNGGTVTIPASSGGSLRQYLRSLRRILGLEPRRVLPGHGDPIDHPAPLIRAYLAHRQLRDDQVVEALTVGARTVEEIADRLYPTLEAEMLAAARENVRAHLQMLEEDGRARHDAGAWSLVLGP
ncbi:MAG: MBL fold metallo-hydrolase [Luteitalea sp.]|nr:MBL fold metallo-hydrolase [Luteitalea sp.]